MTTMLLLLLSGALIGTGVILIWRDVHSKRSDALLLPRDSSAAGAADPDVEIMVSRPAALAPVAPVAPADAREPRRTLGSKLRGLGFNRSDELPLPDTARPSATAQQWAALQPVISSAVEQVNAVVAGAGLAIGMPGEPSLASNRAYGSDRQITVRGLNLAWLRLECTPGGRLTASVNPHAYRLGD
jgi:hypothetical protein